MFNPKELFLRARPASLAEFRLNISEYNAIIACPNPPHEAIAAGRAIAVPSGEFDVGLILEKLPAHFKPDIVNLSARDPGFIPRGLDQFDCPKVMKIGDTFHWGDGSLKGIIEYCQRLQCDYHWVYQGVQHLHFFVEAGLKNVFWLPGTPVIEHYVPEKPSEKSYDVIFRGSQSDFHVYRSYLLRALKAANIPIDIARKPYHECLDDYPKAKIVFNCGLNGDTNRRIFEVLMAGGFLLTDRLSPQSGVFKLFQEGVHFECYGSEAELIEKINHYLNAPDDAERIAAAGQKMLLEHFSQHDTQQRFYRYILQGDLDDAFTLKHDPRARLENSNSTPEDLKLRLEIYQLVQEIHRLNPSLNVTYWRGERPQLISDLADLPRVTLTYANDSLSTIQQWCDQAGVGQQVHYLNLALTSANAQSAQIILLDLPDSLDDLKHELSHILDTLNQTGILVIVGRSSWLYRYRLAMLLRAKGLKTIHLCVSDPNRGFNSDTFQIFKREPLPKRSSSQMEESLVLRFLRFRILVKETVAALPVVRSLRRLKPSLRP